MHKSALQLEHYELAALQLAPVDEFAGNAEGQYPSFDNAEFKSDVEFGQAERGSESPNFLWGIKLRLRCAPKEGCSFPYRFDVSIVGFLNGTDLKDDNRENLVLVNGTSLLYGALRDEILRLTSRMRHGPLLLPTAQFHSLAATHGSDKAQESPATMATAKKPLKIEDSSRP